MKRKIGLLWRKIFPSHVSAKELFLFAVGCIGFDVRIRKLDRVRGHNLLDDIAVLIPKVRPQIVFDIGAHHGESLFKIYNLVHHPMVHSFEPSSISFDKLWAAFQGWPDLYLNKLALGDRTCRVNFNEYDGSPANSVLCINRRTPNVLRETKLLQTVTVEMVTLDDYCSNRGVDRIDWLKIDAQGYDLSVLKGACQLLSEQRIAIISLEINFLPMYENEGDFSETLSYLRPLGYSLVDFYDKNYVNNRLSCCDLLFVRDRKSRATVS